MKHINRMRLAMVPLILLAVAFTLTFAGTAHALVIPAEARSEQAVGAESGDPPLNDFILKHLAPWQDRLIATDFFFNEATVLQFYFLNPDESETDVDLDAFLDAYIAMLQEDVLTHDRVFLDIVETSGKRLHAFDLELNGKFWSNAEFVREPAAAAAIDEVLPYDTIFIPGAEYQITDMFIDDDGTSDFLIIVFDFTNRSEANASVLDLLVPEAIQDGHALDLNEAVTNIAGSAAAIAEPGETVTDCVLAYYLNGDEPIQIVWQDPSGQSGVTFDLTIGSD